MSNVLVRTLSNAALYDDNGEYHGPNEEFELPEESASVHLANGLIRLAGTPDPVAEGPRRPGRRLDTNS